MPVVLRVIGMANGIHMGPMEGWYVHYVDVQLAEVTDDWLQLTPHIDDAWLWSSVENALTAWKETLKSNPVRIDGKPNRPFTAFSVEVVKVSVHEGEVLK